MDYNKAASFWDERSATSVKMAKESLWAEMEKFINAHNTCALATGYENFIRCTPIEYNFKNKKFWMFSEGGKKFYALKNNKNVCLAIFDPYNGFDNLGGMQITGTAEMVEPMSEDYLNMLKCKNISVEALKKLPHKINLICVTPRQIDFLYSKFKKLGYDARQSITL